MTDGKFTAHANPAMMGTDVRTLKAKDDPLGQRRFDTINKSSGGTVLTVDYNFPKPGTTEPLPKQSFVTKVDNQGCGVWLLQIARSKFSRHPPKTVTARHGRADVRFEL